MTLVEQLGEAVRLEDRFVKVGWDMCVLALGVAGGIFPNPEVIKAYTPQGAVVAGLFSVVFSLGAAVLIALLRRQNPQMAWVRPLGALALGGAALAVPAYLALRA